MTHRHIVRRSLFVVVFAVLSAAWLTARPSAAANKLDKLDTSLKFIPDDAAFYSSMLRNREQCEAIAGSRVREKIEQMPVVQMGLMLYNMQATNPQSVPGRIKAALKDPETKEPIALLADMLSDEIFLYGDESFVDFLRVLQEMNIAQNFGPLKMQLSGQAKDVNPSLMQPIALIGSLADNVDSLAVPNMVLGFKLDDTDRAVEQLEELEKSATAVLEADERMKGRLKRAKIDGNDYLVLTLDGQMIPWDELPEDALSRLDLAKGDAEKVISRIKQQKLLIALGVRDDYLLLSIGQSTDALARLGKGKRLIDRPELKPLEKFADKRLTGISYISAEANRQASSSQAQIDGLADLVNEALSRAELTEQQQAKIRKDAAAMAADFEPLMPVPGAAMAVSFLTEEGIEGYQYNWGTNLGLDGSKPLSLLEHVGGAPILAVVARGQYAPQHYDLLAKWVKVGAGYFSEYVLPRLSETGMSKKQQQQVEKFIKLATPLAQRIDKANRDMLIPALADGQAALVIDGQLQSKRFHKALPATKEPMPMIEPALVLGVSDAKLLRKACAEYQAVADGLLEVIRQIEPEAVPEDYSIPRPKITESKAGTIGNYKLPPEWGLDKKILPSFGLSDTVAVIAVSRKHVQRLLQATPSKAGGVLADTDRPLASAGVFDWAAMVDVAKPWADLIVERIDEQSDGDDPSVARQVETVLEVLKVLGKITSESYFENDVLVTHTLIEFRDIPE